MLGIEGHHLFLGLVALLAEVFGTVSGFGSSTIFVPIASFFENFRLVLMLTSFLHLISNFSKIFLFWGSTPSRRALMMSIPSILLTGLGAMISSWVPQRSAEIFLGVLLMILAPFLLWSRYRKWEIPPLVFHLLLAISGFLTGLVGTGGAIRGFALASGGLSKNEFVLLSSIIDSGGDLFRAGVYLQKGYMDWSQWIFIPLLILAGLLGSKLGQLALKRVKQRNFEILVALMIFISGFLLLLNK